MTPLKKFSLAGALLIVAVSVHALVVGNSIADEWELLAALLSLSPIALLGPNLQDANLQQTLALPSAANTTVTVSSGLDLEATASADFLALTECLVNAPILNTTQLPNAATMTYNLVTSANSNMNVVTVLQQSVIVQTGAGGVGAVASSARARIPTNVGTIGRYLGLQAVGAVSNGNCAASSATLKMLF